MLAWIRGMILAILLCGGVALVLGALSWFLFIKPLARM